MTHDIDDTQQQQQQTAHATLVTPDAAPPEEVKPKTPGSTRRGKQYKCGHCHELGHNQKTCPRRTSGGPDQSPIQPAINADDLFGNTNVGLPSTGNGHASSPTQPSSSVGPTTGGGAATTGGTSAPPPPEISLPSPPPRELPSRLEVALDAVHKRIIAADKLVGGALTDEEFQDATNALELSVQNLEKVTKCLDKIEYCVRKCRYSANVISRLSVRNSADTDDERDPKRTKYDNHGLNPSSLALNDAPGPATSGGDGGNGTRNGKQVMADE